MLQVKWLGSFSHIDAKSMHFAYGGCLRRADDKWWLGNEAKYRRRAWAPTGHRADWEGNAANIGSRSICATTKVCRNIWNTSVHWHSMRWWYLWGYI